MYNYITLYNADQVHLIRVSIYHNIHQCGSWMYHDQHPLTFAQDVLENVYVLGIPRIM